MNGGWGPVARSAQRCAFGQQGRWLASSPNHMRKLEYFLGVMATASRTGVIVNPGLHGVRPESERTRRHTNPPYSPLFLK
jgi:hypothetical protein